MIAPNTDQKWGCSDCVHRRGPIQIIDGKQKVRCMCTLKDARTGCPAWSDGKDLDYWPERVGGL